MLGTLESRQPAAGSRQPRGHAGIVLDLNRAREDVIECY